ncbi:MAG: ABC transporter ATP-binding protein [Sphaerochaetaceae bacterium]|nr:ABC transporter ATP-binding protein [Sphaerochaetaceae bacterium]
MDKITSLRMENITKTFPGMKALDNVTIEVKEGEIFALVGENGAGKTTLMNVLMGLYQSDGGCIILNGQKVCFTSPNDSFGCGIGMVHQRYMLVPNLTVKENIALGLKKAWKKVKLDMDFVVSKIEEIGEKYDLVVDPDAYIWQLSVGEQQKVELVKTLCLGAKFLILDEPTSALTPQEIDELIQLLKTMNKKLPMIFISHKLKEVKELSHKLAILRHGKIVFCGDTNDYSSSDIAALMTGREVKMPENNEEKEFGDYALELKNVNVKSIRGFLALNDLNLKVRSGEIMGLAGVSGNGQLELAQIINGLRKIDGGEILFLNEHIENTSPIDIIQKGMGYIPEDRNTEGIVPSFSIKENLILKDIGNEQFSNHTIINNKAINDNAEKLREQFDIRCVNTSLSAGALSGGNIQKVILAREIARKPKFLVAVYPTRGLDMGAAQFIHSKLLEMRKNGVGILLISEELDEIMNLSDNIAVIFKGHIQKVLPAKTATRREIGMLMAGVNND